MVFKKPNWGPPPEGYVAGLGRGATGFVTRADFGPSRISTSAVDSTPLDLAQAPNQQMGPPGFRGAPTAALRELTGVKGGPGASGEQDFSDANYDEWGGYSGSLFAGADTNDAEDKEADNLFLKIDEYMDSRRKRKREEKLAETEKKLEKDRKDYQSMFSNEKKALASVSRTEWESLPDAADLVKRTKKQREAYQRYTPVPDSVINSARIDGQSNSFIDPNSGMASVSGFASTAGGMTTVSNLTELGQARGQLLSIKLDKASESSQVSGRTTSINKEGYMTDLNSMSFNQMHEINDIKKARALMKSVITNNPNSATGWIAAARIEELDGKIQQARNIMAQACQNFIDNEDIWLEAARLSPPDKTKALIAKALSQMPKSKKLWLQAAAKEQDLTIRKQILQKALEQLSQDLDIWKETISLSNPEEAKSLLYRAVQFIPQSTDLWLALAKLETYQNAQSVLNQAIQNIPSDHTIWVNAAKLEEAQGNNEQVSKIISRAVKRLSKLDIKIKREQWLDEAIQAELSGSIITCKSIIKETMMYGMEEHYQESDDEKERSKKIRAVWIENAEVCVSQMAIESARAIFSNAITFYPKKKSLWFEAIQLEEQHGNKESLKDVITRAKDVTKEVFFYLKLAKHLWKQMGDAEQTRNVLMEGHQLHEDSEDMVLAIQKFERENKNYQSAQEVLDKARLINPSERIWMQSVQLYREIGNIDKALTLVNEALTIHKQFWKLWLIKAQLLQQLGQNDEARKTYEEALQIDQVKSNRTIWINYARFETDQEAFTRARTILQKARIRMPNDEEIWIASIRLEIKSDNIKIAQNLLSQALQKQPQSGKLWALQIEIEPAQTRKAQVFNALKNNEKDSDLFVAIAKVFWIERKGEKVKKWLKNAVKLNKDNGDAWAHLVRYEMEFGNDDSVVETLKEFKDADPHHGDLWSREIKKVENWRKDPSLVLKKVAQEIKLFEDL